MKIILTLNQILLPDKFSFYEVLVNILETTKSQVTGKSHKNHHKKFPHSWWEGIPEEELTKSFENYDISLNKYKKKVGTTLEIWEGKKWITKQDPYGWIEWYCLYNGRRSPDDERQIGRWMGLASKRGRFRKWLITMILKKMENITILAYHLLCDKHYNIGDIN